MDRLREEKLTQAIALLGDLGIDAWLTLVRETAEGGDPVLPLLLAHDLVWVSAFLVTRDGQRIAIVGNYDRPVVEAAGVWPEVTGYKEGIGRPLVQTLERLNPRQLAINYAHDDAKADGLSYGLFMLLRGFLANTPYADRLVSAERLIGSLRGRKSPEELVLIRGAVGAAEQIIGGAFSHARPGMTERQLAEAIRGEAAERGLGLAWARDQCPIVNTGPASVLGHGVASDTRMEPGHLLHIDFGVRSEGYCSDLQRTAYVPLEGESTAPAEVLRAFEAVRAAILAAAEALRPGIEGWRVDQAARRELVSRGYSEYAHATGHQVGRAAHDGGCVLGPRWERYGRTVQLEVEEGNVFTLELGVENVTGRGYLGLEEMVLVGRDGCEFLSDPQRELILL